MIGCQTARAADFPPPYIPETRTHHASSQQTPVNSPRPFAPQPTVSTTGDHLVNDSHYPSVHSRVTGPPASTSLPLTLPVPPGTTLNDKPMVARSPSPARHQPWTERRSQTGCYGLRISLSVCFNLPSPWRHQILERGYATGQPSTSSVSLVFSLRLPYPA